MFSGFHHLRGVAVGSSDDARLTVAAADSAPSSFGVYRALPRRANRVENPTGGVMSSSTNVHQTSPPPPLSGLPWNSFHHADAYNTSDDEGDVDSRPIGGSTSSSSFRATNHYPSADASCGSYSSPLGHRCHRDDIARSHSIRRQQPGECVFSSMTTAPLFTAASPSRRQPAAQHLCGAPYITSTAAGAVPASNTPSAKVSGAAVNTTPSFRRRSTGRGDPPRPSDHGVRFSMDNTKRSSCAGAPAPGGYAGTPSDVEGDPAEGDSETDVSTHQNASVVVMTAPRSPNAPYDNYNASIHLSRKVASACTEPRLTQMTLPSSSSCAVEDLLVSTSAAAARIEHPRGYNIAARLGQQQELWRQRARSLPNRRATSAVFAAGKQQSPRLRTAQWAIRLIEEFVAQLAVQQQSAVVKPIVCSPSGVASGVGGRPAGVGGRGATIETTVSDLTATFLSSRYGVLRWRLMLNELAACLHFYQRISPACAVFGEYFIRVDVENLEDFHLFCRLYAAGDIHHCSRVEIRRVSIGTGTDKDASNLYTTVVRRYVDIREVCDRLQHMLQRVYLTHCPPSLLPGQGGSGVSPVLSGDVSVSRQSSGLVQYCYARDPPAHSAQVRRQWHLAAEDVREIKRAVLGWVAGATRQITHERRDCAARRHTGDVKKDQFSQTVSEELQRVSFDRQGWVDAYALVQATVEAVRLVCRVDHTLPERQEEDVGGPNGEDGGVERVDVITNPSEHQRQQISQSMNDPSRRLQLQRTPVSPKYASERYSSYGTSNAKEGGQQSFNPQSSTPVSVDVSPPRTSTKGLLLSSPRSSDASRSRCPDISTRPLPGALRSHPWTMQRPFSLTPQRRMASAEERSPSAPVGRVQQRQQDNKEDTMGTALGHFSPKKSFFSSNEEPYHRHPYVANLRGNRLWAEALKQAAAASQQHVRFLSAYYPYVNAQVQSASPPPKRHGGASAVPGTCEFSSSFVDATVDVFDAELQRRRRYSGDNESGDSSGRIHNPPNSPTPMDAVRGKMSVSNSERARCVAEPTDLLPLRSTLSQVASHLSTVVCTPHLTPVAADSAGSAALLARSTHDGRATPPLPPTSSPSPISSQSMSAPLSMESDWFTSTNHRRSHRTEEMMASDTVLLSPEERRMLDQLEIALQQLEVQHRRYRTAISTDTNATAPNTTYA